MKIYLILAACLLLAACAQEPAPFQKSVEPQSTASAATPPDENAATNVVKQIVQAQKDYFQRNRRYALDYDELIAAHFLAEQPSAAKTGYEIGMRPSADASRYTISATPLAPSPAAHHFSADQTGEIRTDDALPGR
jgi:hypothetical protein